MTLVLRLIMNNGYSFDFSITCFQIVAGLMGKFTYIQDTSLVIAVRT